ncbi:MAG: hypothetical protein EOP84_02655 [Verrucomicrobiaceae bacterium]|nr:MAG: hypothetical protein EOP84_02655 [Verrucomicrobiaceae bacterium]
MILAVAVMAALMTGCGDPPDVANSALPTPASGSVVAEPAPSNAPKEDVNFNAGAPGAAYLGEGFSTQEGWGVWTDGPVAKVNLPTSVVPPGTKVLRFLVNGFIGEASPTQSVQVFINGASAGTWTWTWPGEGAAPAERVVTLPEGTISATAPVMQIEFRIATPVSPADVGLNADARKLGLALSGVSFGAG